MKIFALEGANFGAYHADGTAVVIAESKGAAVDMLIDQAIICARSNICGSPEASSHDCYDGEPGHVNLGWSAYEEGDLTQEMITEKRNALLSIVWTELDISDGPMIVVFNYGCDC
jgi:hypothetical protein